MKVFHSALLRWSVDLCQITDIHFWNGGPLEITYSNGLMRTFNQDGKQILEKNLEAEFKRLQEAFADRACHPVSPAPRNEWTEE